MKIHFGIPIKVACFALGFSLFASRASSHALPPMFQQWPCNNGATGYLVIEDSKGSGKYDKATMRDCDGSLKIISLDIIEPGDTIWHDTTNYGHESAAVMLATAGYEFMTGPVPEPGVCWTWTVAYLNSADLASFDSSGASVCNVSRLSDGSLATSCAMDPPRVEEPALASDITSPEFEVGTAFPLPFSGQVKVPVTLSKPTFIEAILYDVLGHQISYIYSGTMPSGSNFLEINGTSLSAGSYYLRVSTANIVRTVHIIKDFK